MSKRRYICKSCGLNCKTGTRGAIPKSCPQCRGYQKKAWDRKTIKTVYPNGEIRYRYPWITPRTLKSKRYKELFGVSLPSKYYLPHPRPHRPNYQELIFEDRGFVCEDCGTTSKRLYVHHKDERGGSKISQPNNNLENLEVLCAKCHMKAHNIGMHPDLITLQDMREAGFTFEAIGKHCGLSRQRIQQLVKNGENKLS